MERIRMPLTVFTKPWRTLPLERLAQRVREMGFDGVELPVRPGFQVEPQNVDRDLPRAARIFADAGLKIWSIAGAAEERMIAACGNAGVPIIRVMVKIDMMKGYRACVEETRRQYERIVGLLERYRVTIGVQNHEGPFVGSAAGLMDVIEGFEPRHVCAVLDFAHCALAGEPEEIALDIVSGHLGMVNLKNAIRQRVPTDPGEPAKWRVAWVPGREGFASWQRIAHLLRLRQYRIPVCLTAEYSDEAAVDRLILEDLAYAKELLG